MKIPERDVMCIVLSVHFLTFTGNSIDIPLNLNLTSQNIQYTNVRTVDLCWAPYITSTW